MRAERGVVGVRRIFERIGRRGQPREAPVRAGPRLRAAVYAREELDEQGRVVSAVEAQLELTRSFAFQHGWEVVASYSDQTVDPEAAREGLQGLRAGIWRRRFDVVVVSTPDRLYYDVERLVRLAREARLLGVELAFVQAPRDLDLFSDER